MERTHSEEQFPTHFTDGRLRVYTNPSKEVFVEDLKTGAKMRIKSHPDGIQFTTDGRVESVRVSNMIGWQVSRR